MTYQEMVDALVNMNQQERQSAIQDHWQVVLSDGFVAFVQGQIEAGRKMAMSESGFAEVFAALDPSFVEVLKQQAAKDLSRLVEVWDSMVFVYEKLQKQSERQGNTQGMVAHGKHRSMPRGVSVNTAVRCYRCGSDAVGHGLCSGCLATQQDWEQQDLEYDQLRYDRQMDDIQYQRLQDDQIYYNNQQDYNSYTDY
jgi:hypothetical protein